LSPGESDSFGIILEQSGNFPYYGPCLDILYNNS